MNISLTPKQEKYIADQIASGDFQNASELVRDALRLHEFNRNRMLNELRAEIEKGWNGPLSDRSLNDIFNDAVSELKK
jgi:antitoxin ParD1/3/4